MPLRLCQGLALGPPGPQPGSSHCAAARVLSGLPRPAVSSWGQPLAAESVSQCL